MSALILEAPDPNKADISCDFCSSQRPAAWRYPAHDIQVPEAANALSVGDWTACHECHELIAKGSRRLLIERAARLLSKLVPQYTGVPISRTQARKTVEAIHSKFWSARYGRPVPIS